MYKGQLMLYYNPILDEMFIVRRGVIKGYFLLETSFGTTLNRTYEELVTSTTILEDAVIVDINF